ncbi:MAG: carbohydrate ABC transporter permease [Lachnospiraceae bacterium]|jgi:multiple sugar transport system permease protein|nr:carbohydrate ABC transporter permease [Lachnospiraceae bacterium]MCH4063988.1 carbohydrate ABC transporter permease [Lachnospiraceae bacterium]MCH4103288.1 carbohydrate ABC transporter permease [Lachnospiraceae bacterium]
MGYEAKKRTTALVIHLILIAGSIVMLLPFAWMVLTAFKTKSQAVSVSPFYIFPPDGWHLENFSIVWESYNFAKLYLNTLLMIFFRVVCAVMTATMAGYAFGRLKFPFKRLLFAVLLMQMMVPGQIFIIPQYLMVTKIGALNTTFGLVFPGLVTAFGTYLMKQGYQSLPKDLEEAAEIDGCNIGQRFLLVMMPLAKSSMVSLGIFTALFAYKDMMWPMIVSNQLDKTTLAAALARLQGQFGSNYPQIMAGALMAIIPMLIIYLVFQKQFVQGIATSGGKL